MRGFVRVLVAAVASTCLTAAAQAKVYITVDLARQTMHVEAGDQVFDWKISSGKRGYETPAGTYGVLWMDKDHHSDEYEQAPMPDAIFFSPGFAIHGFGRSPWGHPASHGCVRLPVAKAAILFDLVKAEGAEIEIDGHSPAATVTARRTRRTEDQDADAAGSRGFYNGVDAGRSAAYAAPAAPSDAAPPPATFNTLFGQMY